MTDRLRPPNFEQVLLEKVRVAAHYSLSLRDMNFIRNHAEMSARLDEVGRMVVVSLHSYILAGPGKKKIDVEEKWPADWWQAFRERWFPKWWLSRWPVKYKKISVHEELHTRMCPHLNMKTEDRHHVAFLMQRDQQ